MTTPEISIAEAKPDKLFYVVANFVVVNKADRTILLLQRGEHEKVHRLKWALAGGKLEHKNVAKMIKEEGVDPLEGIENVLGKLAVIETKEEGGLDVNAEGAPIIKNKVFIRPEGIPVFMATLVAEYKGGDVILEEGIIGFAWVKEEDLDDYDCIPGVQEEARKALALIN